MLNILVAVLGLIDNGMSEENIEKITKSDSNFAPPFVDSLPFIIYFHSLSLIYYQWFITIHNSNGHCLINNISIPKKVINLYTSYTLNPHLRNLNTDFTFGKCLFGSVKLIKNADLDKYKYSSHSIRFESLSKFWFTDGSFGKNVIIFGADISSSAYIDNKGKDISVLGEGPTQRLDNSTLTAEAVFPINFTQPNKRFVLSLHYSGSNSLLFVNA